MYEKASHGLLELVCSMVLRGPIYKKVEEPQQEKGEYLINSPFLLKLI